MPQDEFYFRAFREHCMGTQIRFVFWPRKCSLSGRTLWLERVYKQTAMWTGPGDPVFEYRYYDRTEFMIAKLKGIT